jgi:large subunit ribosomal protein L35
MPRRSRFKPTKKEIEMPKIKTKSGAKKRFKVTAKGKVKAQNAYMRHMQMNKPKSMKRKARGTSTLSKPDARIVLRNWLPYNRKQKNKPAAKQVEGGA